MTSDRYIRTYTAILYLFLCHLHNSNSLSSLATNSTIRSKRQSYGTSCLLPDHPVNGRFILQGAGSSYVPNGPTLSSSSIKLVCDPDYQKEGSEQLFCISGDWIGGDVSKQRCTLVECGVKGSGATRLRRLVGGSTAEVGEHPWIVAIYDGDKFNCGGSIISNRFVVSAAHCFTQPDGLPRDKSSYRIVAGKYYSSLNDQRDDSRKQVREIEKLFVNENFRGVVQNYGSDITIIEVQEDFQWTKYVRPVCIDWADREDLVEGNIGVVGGWGHTEENGVPSEELKILEVPYQSRSKCRQHLEKDFYEKYFTADKFCSGFVNQNKGICRGDGGGGFYVNRSGRYFIRGIASLASLSSNGCDSNNFGLYTRISMFDQWIQEKTNRFVDGCLLPEHPANGRFSVSGVSNSYIPNTPIRSTTSISLICDPGYFKNGNEKLYCISGTWVGGDVSNQRCLKLCPPLNDESVRVSCRRNNLSVNCTEAVEGTRATIKCAPFFKDVYSRRPIMTCRNGAWAPNLVACIPECGLQRDTAKTVVIGGTPAIVGEHPWTVAIYNGSNSHICGGSIISRRYVLSAAHCFADVEGQPFDGSLFTIVAGKQFRVLDDSRDKSRTQIRKVARLYVHEDYQGRWQNFANDVAIAKVEKEFILTKYVQPVCLDAADDLDFVEENNGVVHGWGYTEEVGVPSDELKTVVLPYHTKTICKEHLPDDFFRRFFTQDKFCAGYVDKGTNVCSGDSGGGFYMNSSSSFFVRGIVSLVHSTLATICDSNKFALYTKVSKFDDWIYRITEGYV